MGAWLKEPESLLPTAKPVHDDVVFFAGFYEGEGSVCGMPRKRCIVQVPQKDPEVLYRARSLWGGTVRVNDRGISVWVMSGDRARLFIQTIYPLLSSRRKAQAEKAGAMQLSGRSGLSKSGMTAERAALRASMTDVERHRETTLRYYYRNKEKMLATTKAWQKANREHLNERQREYRKKRKEIQTGNFGNQDSKSGERSQLVN